MDGGCFVLVFVDRNLQGDSFRGPSQKIIAVERGYRNASEPTGRSRRISQANMFGISCSSRSSGK